MSWVSQIKNKLLCEQTNTYLEKKSCKLLLARQSIYNLLIGLFVCFDQNSVHTYVRDTTEQTRTYCKYGDTGILPGKFLLWRA
jgi:hypothetical protein